MNVIVEARLPAVIGRLGSRFKVNCSAIQATATKYARGAILQKPARLTSVACHRERHDEAGDDEEQIDAAIAECQPLTVRLERADIVDRMQNDHQHGSDAPQHLNSL
jgi:hypothetical protein